MKKVLFVSTIIFISTLVRAECYHNGYYVRFGMMVSDSTSDNGYAHVYGYVFVYSCDLNIDSLRCTEHLKKAFVRGKEDDTLTYFQHRMIYQYPRSHNPDSPLEEKIPIYYLLNKATVPLKNIRWIEINELIRYPSYIKISSELQLCDNTWIGQVPIKIVAFWSNWSFVCSHQLFIHANSEKVDAVIRQLALKQKELEGMKYEDIDNNSVKINKEIEEIVRKLDGEKVVVVSECTD